MWRPQWCYVCCRWGQSTFPNTLFDRSTTATKSGALSPAQTDPKMLGTFKRFVVGCRWHSVFTHSKLVCCRCEGGWRRWSLGWTRRESRPLGPSKNNYQSNVGWTKHIGLAGSQDVGTGGQLSSITVQQCWNAGHFSNKVFCITSLVGHKVTAMSRAQIHKQLAPS